MSRDPVIYGTSRKGWGWYGWVKWPLSSNGLHRSGKRWPFKWMATLSARRMADGGTPATPAQVHDYEVGGLDPEGWL